MDGEARCFTEPLTGCFTRVHDWSRFFLKGRLAAKLDGRPATLYVLHIPSRTSTCRVVPWAYWLHACGCWGHVRFCHVSPRTPATACFGESWLLCFHTRWSVSWKSVRCAMRGRDSPPDTKTPSFSHAVALVLHTHDAATMTHTDTGVWVPLHLPSENSVSSGSSVSHTGLHLLHTDDLIMHLLTMTCTSPGPDSPVRPVHMNVNRAGERWPLALPNTCGYVCVHRLSPLFSYTERSRGAGCFTWHLARGFPPRPCRRRPPAPRFFFSVSVSRMVERTGCFTWILAWGFPPRPAVRPRAGTRWRRHRCFSFAFHGLHLPPRDPRDRVARSPRRDINTTCSVALLLCSRGRHVCGALLGTWFGVFSRQYLYCRPQRDEGFRCRMGSPTGGGGRNVSGTCTLAVRVPWRSRAVLLTAESDWVFHLVAHQRVSLAAVGLLLLLLPALHIQALRACSCTSQATEDRTHPCIIYVHMADRFACVHGGHGAARMPACCGQFQLEAGRIAWQKKPGGEDRWRNAWSGSQTVPGVRDDSGVAKAST